MGLNFTLTTSLGSLDLLGEVPGGGSYETLFPQSIEIQAFGHRFQVVTIETLIRLKRAAGRPKDLEPIAELEALLAERRRMEETGEIPPNG
jgi:predicted nucleotidyltransferase